MALKAPYKTLEKSTFKEVTGNLEFFLLFVSSSCGPYLVYFFIISWKSISIFIIVKINRLSKILKILLVSVYAMTLRRRYKLIITHVLKVYICKGQRKLFKTFLFDSELFNCAIYFRVNITGESCYFLRLTIPNKWFDISPMAKESLLI